MGKLLRCSKTRGSSYIRQPRDSWPIYNRFSLHPGCSIKTTDSVNRERWWYEKESSRLLAMAHLRTADVIVL